MTPLQLLSTLVIVSSAVLGQTNCALDQAHTGDVVKLRGIVQPGGHDVFITPESCPGVRVIVVWDQNSSARTNRDEKFKEFVRYLTEEQQQPSAICFDCFRWEVTAELAGRIAVAPKAGLIGDPQTGKRIEGFGHPLPFSRYQLTLTSASVLSVRERPR